MSATEAGAQRGTQLFVRALDTLESVPVFTGRPRGPFVSPDGQWIGFMDARRVEESADDRRAGSSPGGDSTPPRLSARRGDRMTPIIFATTNGATGLQQVAAAGGGPTTVLTRPNARTGRS